MNSIYTRRFATGNVTALPAHGKNMPECGVERANPYTQHME